MKITFLGTAAYRPTAARHVSGIYISHASGGVILDCGVETHHQLDRFAPGAPVDAICITHGDRDHVSGIWSFLRRMSQAGRVDPFTIYAPPSVLQSIEERISSNRCEPPADLRLVPALADGMLDLPGCRIRAFATAHRPGSVGFVLDEVQSVPAPSPYMSSLERFRADGAPLRLAYTGDTLPTPVVIEAVRGVDVLIHEATYLNDEIRLALGNKHTTAGWAGDVARQAEVGFLLMTHVIQRYTEAQIQRMEQEAEAAFGSLLPGAARMAYDGLVLEVSALRDLGLSLGAGRGAQPSRSALQSKTRLGL